MMPVLDGVLKVGSQLIDRLWPDPEQRATAKLELVRLHQAGELKELEISMSAIIAEAQSADAWTSRARPSFLYVIYIVILMCVAGGVIGIWWPEQTAQAATNVNQLLGSIPESLWALFGAGYLGYTGARSFDKSRLRR